MLGGEQDRQHRPHEAPVGIGREFLPHDALGELPLLERQRRLAREFIRMRQQVGLGAGVKIVLQIVGRERVEHTNRRRAIAPHLRRQIAHVPHARLVALELGHAVEPCVHLRGIGGGRIFGDRALHEGAPERLPGLGKTENF